MTKMQFDVTTKNALAERRRERDTKTASQLVIEYRAQRRAEDAEILSTLGVGIRK